MTDPALLFTECCSKIVRFIYPMLHLVPSL